VFKEAASLAYNVAKLEADRFNMGRDPHAAFGLKGAEQTIGDVEWVDYWFGRGTDDDF
jgi:hypothetical protein